MNQRMDAISDNAIVGVSERLRAVKWERAGVLYARFAVGTAFLSAVASRFGVWNRTLDLTHFANFMQYAAEVNSFLPKAWIPLIAWAATIAETFMRNPADIRDMATMGVARQRGSARHIWYGNGDLFRNQVAHGLFSFLCLSSSCIADAARLHGRTGKNLSITEMEINHDTTKVQHRDGNRDAGRDDPELRESCR